MSKATKAIFLIDAIGSLVIGALLLLIPGRTLTTVSWLPFDALMTRLVGAALLALAWGSFRGWRATEYQQVAILVEVQAIFATLGAIGLLRHLVSAWYPPIGWITFGLLAVMALAWGFVWLRRPRSS
jgi:hypothetical protein